jgi:hypothetical protein
MPSAPARLKPARLRMQIEAIAVAAEDIKQGRGKRWHDAAED